jgi:16S rRNA (cytosine1402-N4)-methyltransferase
MHFHTPVMCSQVLNYLVTKKNGIYLDCTLGGGGHSTEIIKKIYPEGLLIGLDQDIEALEFARERLRDYLDRIVLIKGNFGDLKPLLKELGYKQITGILFDLGLSSHQLESKSRGFSFQEDNPLDMRMDVSKETDACFVVNNYSEKDLWELFSKYGEERFSRSIARVIVRERKNGEIKTTSQLAKLVTDVYARHKKDRWRIHPATRVFQALRIEVNDELNILKRALEEAISILEQQGRICIISYHSLEDRIAKHTFKNFAEKGHVILNGYGVKILSKKPIYPSEDEVKINRRARSAKMRVAEKVFSEGVSKR